MLQIKKFGHALLPTVVEGVGKSEVKFLVAGLSEVAGMNRIRRY